MAETRDPEYPYIPFPDRPVCPSCGEQEAVVSGGQWRNGDCVWFSCCCGETWDTRRTAPSAASTP